MDTGESLSGFRLFKEHFNALFTFHFTLLKRNSTSLIGIVIMAVYMAFIAGMNNVSSSSTDLSWTPMGDASFLCSDTDGCTDILYAPSGDTDVAALIASTTAIIEENLNLAAGTVTTMGFDTNADMYAYAKLSANAGLVASAIYVDPTTLVLDSAEGADVIDVQFYMPLDSGQTTIVAASSAAYKSSGYLLLQTAFNQAVLSKTLDRQVSIDMSTAPLPVSAQSSVMMMPYFALFVLFISAQFAAMRYAQEREGGMKQAVVGAGISRSAYWVSHLCCSMIEMSIAIVVLCIAFYMFGISKALDTTMLGVVLLVGMPSYAGVVLCLAVLCRTKKGAGAMVSLVMILFIMLSMVSMLIWGLDAVWQVLCIVFVPCMSSSLPATGVCIETKGHTVALQKHMEDTAHITRETETRLDTTTATIERLSTELAEQSESAQKRQREIEFLWQQDYPSEYDMHIALAQLFKRLKDPHSVYVPPSCFNILYWAHPVALGTSLDTDAGEQKIYLRNLPSNYSFVSLQYVQQLLTDDTAKAQLLLSMLAEEAEVTGITINTATGILGEKMDPMVAVRDFADRQVYISKNAAVRFDQAIRSDWYLRGKMYEAPPHSITYTVLHGGVEVNMEVPFFGVSPQMLTSPEDLMSFCPIRDGAFVTAPEPTQRLVEMQAPPPSPVQGTAEREAEAVGSALNAMRGSLPTGTAKTAVASDLRRVFVANKLSLYMYEPDGTDYVAILQIPSFSPSSPTQWRLDLLTALDLISESTAEYLVVDLRYNGGGYVCLGVMLDFLLNPDASHPSSGLYDIKKTPVTDAVLPAMEGDDQNYEYVSHTPRDLAYFADTDRTKTFTNSFYGEPGASVSTDVFENGYYDTHTFCAMDFFNEDGTRNGQLGETARWARPLPPTNILFVTAGYCGSTCGCTVARAKEMGIGKTVAVGGLWVKDQLTGDMVIDADNALSVVSFPGGSVLDSDYVTSVMEEYGVEPDTLHGLPGPMPRDNYLRFPYHEIYSSLETDKVLEFSDIQPDFHIPFWPGAGQGSAESLPLMLEAVLPVFNMHAPWEAQLSPACSTSNHAVNGQVWNEESGSFDGDCSIMWCQDGYYPDGGVCEVQPPTDFGTVHLWPLLLLIFVVIIFLLCLAYTLVKKRRTMSEQRKSLIGNGTELGQAV
ncbi:hypothetical protein KIPB_003868 [Kipferlia bialata]|uniref:ABC-2 type transporter transmembrane domain-containing protein n=1 Tax=Kipferlia bialata TaxID=797122 RepID=A0A9K3CUR6_9EUKA|nr:hypothetical protein KIPB_003868 [Kipferlia bialata]|eukprot:g3868.t1